VITVGRPPGGPPRTLEQKLKTGNPSRRPLPDRSKLTLLPGADTVPAPARPLGTVGMEMWTRMWTSGAIWLAKNVDAESVLIVCEQIDERQALRAAVFRDGEWRTRGALRALDAQVMTGLAMLGFNPVDRVRLGVAEVRSESKLAEVRRLNEEKKASGEP
jgi:hypothetical protein